MENLLKKAVLLPVLYTEAPELSEEQMENLGIKPKDVKREFGTSKKLFAVITSIEEGMSDEFDGKEYSVIETDTGDYSIPVHIDDLCTALDIDFENPFGM